MIALLDSTSWVVKGAEKKAALEEQISTATKLKTTAPASTLNVTQVSLKGVLSDLDLEITEQGADVEVLLAKVASGEWSAVAVATAYCHRAVAAHQLVNCLTEVFFDQAIATAKKLDQHLATTGRTIGPLHGLPISLKDQIDIKGVELTMGYVGWIGNISDKNAVLADILLKQGAILYCRTNVPQALMYAEAYNNVFGTTSNPFNRKLTCGGSSGGEGALIAMRGSPLGVGSDLGGSIRIPSSFNGLYGMRPSFNRIPYQDSTNSMEGQEAIPSVLGPMASSASAIKLFLKAVIDSQPWLYDPVAIRQPWSDAEYHLQSHGGENGKLCFAIMWDDGIALPQPPYIRALKECKAAILAAGHEVIDWTPYGLSTSLELLLDIYAADGGSDIQAACALSGEPQLGWVLPTDPKHLSTFEYWALCHKRRQHLKKQLDHWQSSVCQTSTGRPIDAIIAPVSATAPTPHKAEGYIGYTGFCNLADYPSVVFPVTAVDPSVDVKLAPHEFRTRSDKLVYDLYDDPENYRDAPIGLQCIAQKGEDEAVIRMMEIVDAALKARKV